MMRLRAMSGRGVAWAVMVAVMAVMGGGVASRAGELEAKIAAVTEAAEFRQAQWGLLVVDRTTGETLYERNAERMFVPASTTKLFSTAAAWVTFGPDRRVKTPVVATGAIDAEGTLAGDLIVVCRGDLNLGGRGASGGTLSFTESDHTYAEFSDTAVLHEGDPAAGLEELARQCAAAGLKRLDGEVLIDERLFEATETTGSGPRQARAAQINDNVVDFVIAPAAKVGEAATVEHRPQSALIAIDAAVTTGGANEPTAVTITSPSPWRYVVRGKIAAGRKPLVRMREAADGAQLMRAMLIEALGRAGVSVRASALEEHPAGRLPAREAIAGMTRVAELESVPFREEATMLLKVSHNLHATTMPLLLAAERGETTLDAGLRQQARILAELGVEPGTISFGGGAGGDRADYVTPRAAAAVLTAMAKREDFSQWRATLPVLGVDGTLAKSVGPESPARGRFQAKTGTLGWRNRLNGGFLLTSKALAGYGRTKSDREVIVALYVNLVQLEQSSEAGRVGMVLGKLCEVIHEEL